MAENRAACPICGGPRDPAFRPFCSRRCADVDLARWFRGDYAVPAVEEEDAPEDDPRGDEPGPARSGR